MLVSPNNINLAENLINVAFYENVSNDETYEFDFQTDSLFVSDMVDLGEGAYPVFLILITMDWMISLLEITVILKQVTMWANLRSMKIPALLQIRNSH